MAAPKIIVFGSLNGQLRSAFQKLATLHARNNFSLAVLTGDVFGSTDDDDEQVSALLDGAMEVPVPTYFTIGSRALPARIAAKVEASEEICTNLQYPGKRSITRTMCGLRIVALGGLPCTDAAAETQAHQRQLAHHTEEDAKMLRGANHADVLLRSIWPAQVWNGSSVSLQPQHQASVISTKEVAELCTAIKPRYHLSSSPQSFFYEREPFRNGTTGDGDVANITRFISIAPFGNDAKAKAMYAFALTPSDAAASSAITDSPFVARSHKRGRNGEVFSRFGGDFADGHHFSRQPKRRRASRPPGSGQCYFCLSNPNLSVHMCCSIGEDAYITTAKGPLPTPVTFKEQGLDFPGHFIIIPLPHAPTIPSLGDVSDPSSEASRTYREMTRFREALQAMISARSSYKLGVVTWEISRRRNVHLIWQLMAVPADMIRNGVAEAAFRVEAGNLQYPVLKGEALDLRDQAGAGDFFRVWLWADDGEDKIKGKSLVMSLAPEMRFDLQFGRRVLAKLLKLEKRFVWQECQQTVEEETRDVEAFREAFKPWDITLAE